MKHIQDIIESKSTNLLQIVFLEQFFYGFELIFVETAFIAHLKASLVLLVGIFRFDLASGQVLIHI